MISLTCNTQFLFTIFLCVNISACSALKSCGTFSGYTETTFFLCDGKTIASHGEIKFELGFFTPKGNLNKNKYLGIWYLEDPETVVWVANRDHPLPETSVGSFGIPNNGEGNLHIWDEKGNSYFSTELEPLESFNSRTARLSDNGNLVLSDEISGNKLWQSFDHPTDTFLPGMKMSENLMLISWRSRDDPSYGNFRFERGKDCNYVIMNRAIKYWESSSDCRLNFTNRNKMYDAATYLLNNYENNNNNHNRVTKPPYRCLNASLDPSIPDLNKTRLLMSSLGEIEYFKWVVSDEKKNWQKIWSEPQTRCSFYNVCGKFGICRTEGKILCTCVRGFEPAVPEAWSSGDYSCGCKRQSILCGKEKNYTFVELAVIKVEDPYPYPYPYEIESEEDKDPEDICKQVCLNHECRCTAYSYWYGSGTKGSRSAYDCYIWTADLVGLQVGYAAEDQLRNISIKVVHTTIQSGASVQNQLKGTHRRNKSLPLIIVVITSVIAVVLLPGSISYIIYYRRMVAKRQESRKDVKGNTVLGLHRPPPSIRQFSEEDKNNIDVPFFDLETILAATDSFSDANKLGQGGFGPVYKGMFRGQEIAVKRMSVHSTQGLEELKNEVVLIAKLQHRNLVRLLGYCIEGDENILLYEYMPNKSLDAFIFGQTLCVLNWEKRFEIILGIARGLLYLHQDSRLRVIHRDLKVSNILLDEDMNPKISDFGLARIVRGEVTKANTIKVVGTHGYMSPEYALNGLFSIKSDVFSFGVVVLEIISGKRNTGFYESQQDLNLLGYAWRLWKEDKQLDMMDQKIVECCNKSEVLKCIFVGLLCVQEDPDERPTMSNVLVMLGSTQIENLPGPKQPAFVARTNQQTMSNDEQTQSNNELTLSAIEGR